MMTSFVHKSGSILRSTDCVNVGGGLSQNGVVLSEGARVVPSSVERVNVKDHCGLVQISDFDYPIWLSAVGTGLASVS